MAITFSIPNTEIIITTGQTTVTVQDMVNAIRLFEYSFQMMGNKKILNASGKSPLGGGVFTEIVQELQNPWTLRFVDEATAHTSVTGGTTLAIDGAGDPRPVTTNFALTINQSISGTLVEAGVSGLTAAEALQLSVLGKILRNRQYTDPDTGIMTVFDDDNVTPLYTTQLFEDIAGTVKYKGKGANRRDRLV